MRWFDHFWREEDIEAMGNWGKRPLYEAADFGSHAVACFLLESGADSNAKTNSGVMAADLAAHRNYKEVVLLQSHK